MSWNRKCSTHPREPAVASEKVGNQRRVDFCRECWDRHRVAVLRHSPTFDPRALVGKGVMQFAFTPMTEMVRERPEPPRKSTRVPYR